MEKTQSPDSFLDYFAETEHFLHNLNPKAYEPPFLTKVFSPMRKAVFEAAQNACNAQKENMLYFVSKFETDYVETLRSKLREHYIDFILQKHYEIPEEIDIKEVESFGAISELAQLAIAIAEWTLEVEINAYTLEGLQLYGLVEQQEKKQEDYLKLLKKEYSYKKKSTFVATAEYVLRRVINFACGKVASIALAKGMSKGGFQGKDILDLVLSLSTTGLTQIPWNTVASTLNVTWVVGGFVCSHFVQKVNDYAVKKEVFNNMKHVQEVFEANKLHLMTERKTLLDLIDKILTEEDNEKYKWDLDVLLKTVNEVLEPTESHEGHHKGKLLEMSDRSKMFKVKEEDDVVVVEEKEFQEKVDDQSGVVIVEW